MERAERDRLILSLSKNVLYIALSFGRRLPRHMTRDDIISEGWIGAMRAVDNWDPARGKLNTYADRRIRGAILDYLRRLDPLVRKERQAYKVATRAAMAAFVLPPKPPARIVDIDHVRMPGLKDLAFREVVVRLDLEKIVARADLSPREETIVRRLFLVEEPAGSVAQSLKLHESRVAQLKSRALGKLRAAA